MILTQAQAEAVYSAMCALNNVGAKIKAKFGDQATEVVNVWEDDEGFVKVVQLRSYAGRDREFYDNQSAFAAAYNLQ